MTVDELLEKMTLQDIINYHERLIRALGLHFASTLV